MPSASAMGSKVFGALIRARNSSGISQAHIAERLGVSREHFCRIENGHAMADSDQLFRWAELVGVEICAQPITYEAV